MAPQSFRVLLALSTLAMGLPSAVSAQVVLPTVSGNFGQLPLTNTQFALDRFTQEEPYIVLEWTATFAGFSVDSFDYELSYDRSVIGLDAPVESIRVKLEEVPNVGLATGRVVNGERHQIRIRPVSIVCVATSSTTNPCEGRGVNSDVGRRKIVLSIFQAGNFTETAPNVTQSWEFQYDTRRPDAPVITKVDSGDERLVVSWTAPTPIADNSSYELLYWAETATMSELPTRSPDKRITGIALNPTKTSIPELVNEQPYVIAMQTVDPFGNISAVGPPVVASPTNVRDFYEYYREQNGTEEGGFCFVATAAFGDYDAPAVKVLRVLRDRVLAQLPLGETFIGAYYRYGPRLARAIASDDGDRAWARYTLMPIVVAAGALMLAPLALLGWALFRVARRRPVALLALLVIASPARGDNTTRAKPTGPIGFGFEVRGGPYLPRMATELSPEGAAFKPIFASGDTTRVDPNPLYRLGVDVQLLRGVGTLGIGGSFGFMQFVGRGLFKDGTRSADTSVFNVLPLELTAFYRFDLLEDRLGIPIIPYLRGGLAYHLWWVTNGKGEIATVGSGDDKLTARGGKFGLTASFGAALLLNFIEPNTSRSMYESFGVRGTYLFGQLDVLEVDGFGGNGFDFSDLTWSVGLSFER